MASLSHIPTIVSLPSASILYIAPSVGVVAGYLYSGIKWFSLPVKPVPVHGWPSFGIPISDGLVSLVNLI